MHGKSNIKFKHKILWKGLSLFTIKFFNVNIYSHITGKISISLNRLPHGLGCAPTTILTIFFVNIFPLLDELPKIIFPCLL